MFYKKYFPECIWDNVKIEKVQNVCFIYIKFVTKTKYDPGR